jgi:hypothetical protein
LAGARETLPGSASQFTLCHGPQFSEFTWALIRSAVRQVHWMRPGREFDSMRLAVLIVSPNSVYLRAGANISRITRAPACNIEMSATVSGKSGVEF